MGCVPGQSLGCSLVSALEFAPGRPPEALFHVWAPRGLNANHRPPMTVPQSAFAGSFHSCLQCNQPFQEFSHVAPEGDVRVSSTHVHLRLGNEPRLRHSTPYLTPIF